MIQRFTLYFILIALTGLGSLKLSAEQVDEELLGSLKLEATHDLERLKSLKSERANKKIYENEREKGLGTFLEEQEKWDLLREKGVAEYRKRKKVESPQEGGPEYKADQLKKKIAEEKFEKSRRILVNTKQKVFSQNKDLISSLEADELGLDRKRPRYDLRKRGQNKWVKNGASGRPSSGNSSSGPGYSPPPPAPVFDDFPPPPISDFQNAPPMIDGFEEIPPPPPPPVYESFGNQPGGFDPGFSEFPPPPPPPPDFDF
ncbi:MAG: hypothetical protein H7061_08430 [Bdellovibrionaceae bacterium]|nr:hypothetical protein [Bdellovibrio sp.]